MGSPADLRILRKSWRTWRKVNINFPNSNARRKKNLKKNPITVERYQVRGDINIIGLSEGGKNETEGKPEVIRAETFPN